MQNEWIASQNIVSFIQLMYSSIKQVYLFHTVLRKVPYVEDKYHDMMSRSQKSMEQNFYTFTVMG